MEDYAAILNAVEINLLTKKDDHNILFTGK